MEQGFPQAIDSTSRLEWAACPTKFYYARIRRIRPAGKSVHLVFGGALADGLHAFRVAYYGENQPLDDCLNAGWHAIIRHWGWFEPPENTLKTLGNCLLLLEDYVHHFSSDDIIPADFDGEPACEFSFSLPVPGTAHPDTGDPILFTGRFDMLARYGRSLFVLDDKTASRLGASWQNQWRLSSQMLAYCWACRQYGLRIQGAIIRGSSVQTHANKFEQCLQSYPEWMVDRWFEQFRRDINAAIEAYKQGQWDMNLGNACTDYGGCKFLELCTSKNPEPTIEMEFEHDDWDPLQ